MLSPNGKLFFFLHLAAALSLCAACEEQAVDPATDAQAPKGGKNSPDKAAATATEQPFKPTHTELMDQNFDYVSSMMGQGFTFRNPNASGGCGCGSSFTV